MCALHLIVSMQSAGESFQTTKSGKFFVFARQVNDPPQQQTNKKEENANRCCCSLPHIRERIYLYYSFFVSFAGHVVHRANEQSKQDKQRRCTCEMKKWRFVCEFCLSKNFVVDLFFFFFFWSVFVFTLQRNFNLVATNQICYGHAADPHTRVHLTHSLHAFN